MTRWFSAHVVMYFKFQDGPQELFPIYENVILVQAKDDAEALAKAENAGRQSEDPTCKYDGRAATLTFAGVRKMISCEFSQAPADGEEATYSQFTVKDAAALSLFVAGKPVPVEYVE